MSGDAKPSLINPKSSSIPTRIVEIKDASQMPKDFSTTPGGTLFSTTPGGKLVVLSDSHCKSLFHGFFIIIEVCIFA